MSFPSPHIRVEIDLRKVRQNVMDIRQQTGVPIIAVIKADAYGLGAKEIAPAIADLVEEFCLFSLEEAIAIDLWNRTSKPAITIGPPRSDDPQEYLSHHVRPAVSSPEQARRLKAAHPILCVDTGQQRFVCPPERIDETIRAGNIDDAFTHATSIEQVRKFSELMKGKGSWLHAAGSSLLHESEARFAAVRPGLALYAGAVRVSTRLVEVHQSRGPAGYSGFQSAYHGVILVGYSNGLRTGPCLVNGRSSSILEVGMQSAFVEIGTSENVGDEVVLLGETLTPQEIAPDWATAPHEVLFRLAGSGTRQYTQ
jgi:alanine racemase